MPGLHARLSPSSAERWLECPASVRMQDLVPPEAESVYAAEGTACHALAEIEASVEFGFITPQQGKSRRASWRKRYAIDHDTEVEMEVHVASYIELLKERLELYPNSQLQLEQRLPTGLPDDGKGTSDAVIVSPVHVEIIDLKYGQGVQVEAENNPQLRIYGYGALTTYGDVLGDTEVVRTTVFQPRLSHVDTEELSADELRAWHASILPTAELALTDDAPFGPSETACRWCPASGRCRAQLEKVFEEPFEVPETLEPDEVARTLARVPMVRDWLSAFEEAALSMAYSEGIPIPGYKVVRSGGKRAVRDDARAIEVLVEAGFPRDKVSRTTAQTLGVLEKLVGKERFKELLEEPGIVTKSEGKESLVPESDKREAIAPNTEAQKEFSDEPE